MRRLGETKTTESDRICPLSRPVLVYAHTHTHASTTPCLYLLTAVPNENRLIYKM